jgi:ATP-binding cassette, subfamily B, bacterial MsbA
MKEGKEATPKLTFRETIRASWRPYLRLIRYAKPYKVRFGLGMGFGLACGAISGLLPLVITRVTSFIFHGMTGTNTRALARAAAASSGHEAKIDSLVAICMLIPLIMIVRSICAFGTAYYTAWVSNRVVTDIRNELFSKIMRHSMDFFNRMRAGFLMSRISNDTRALQTALTTVSTDLFKQPIAVVVSVCVLIYMDWRFTLVTLVLFPICLVPILIYSGKARREIKSQQKKMGQMTVTMQESFAGIRVIKSFGRETHQEDTFRRNNLQQFQKTMRITKSLEAIGPLVEGIAALGVGLALLYVYMAHLSAAKFIGLMSGIFLLYEPIKTLSKLHVVTQRSITATTAVFGILDSEPSVQDAPNAITLPRSAGQIEFQNVTLRYASGTTDALKNVSLRVESGKSYALVGPSGAGKSSMLSLILRLYDPNTGVLRIDNHDIRAITQDSLREQIGLVTQETFLFHDTIFKNIQFGRLDATEEEIYAAARTAFAHDFIIAQPEGYQSIVGDKGMLLSGGQQQRLAIARALLKNAPILLLDEATSSLDTESENQIQLALQKLAAGRTVIAIAHRLSTILSADQIVVMDAGRIIEMGNHRELLEQSGYYRRLYDLQFNRQSDETGADEPSLVEVLT